MELSSIEVSCRCGSTIKARAELAGRRVKCPNCQNVVAIPRPGSNASSPAAATPAPRPAVEEELGLAPDANADQPIGLQPDATQPTQSMPQQPVQQPVQPPYQQPYQQPVQQPALAEVANWYVRNEVGGQFGPMTKSQLNQGVAAGQVTGACQVWMYGQAPMFAAQIFPQLGMAQAAPGLQPMAPQMGGDIRLQPAESPAPAPEPVGMRQVKLRSKSIPAYRRHDFCSGIIGTHVAMMVIGWIPIIGIVAAIAGFFTSMGVIAVCVIVLTGPVYYNSSGPSGKRDVWSNGNKAAAVILLPLFLTVYGFIVYAVFNALNN